MARRSREQRIGGFGGPLAAYVEYLEQFVHFLQSQVRYLSQQVGHQQPPTQQLIQNQPSTQQSQSSTHQLSGSLVFQLETPGSQAVKATKPSIEPWKAATREFLGQVPKDEEGWSARRKQVHLHESETVIHTFCLLTRHSPRVRSLEIGDAPGDEASIFDLLGDYGGFANALGAHRAYATQIAYYGTLLFVCLSIIALRAGSDLEAVDDHIRKFLTDQQGKECTAGEIYLSQLRTGALWAVRRMDELYEKGLKHRGPETFVLCGLSIHCYRKFAQCKETDKFTSEVAICEPPEGEPQADLPFHIPFLIKVILGDRCSLGQINKALGTRLHQETFNAWAYAAWRRIDSLLRIRCLPRARKRRKVSHDNETCEERDNSYTEARSDGDVCFTPKTAAAESTQDDLGGIVDQLQRLIIDTHPDHTPDHTDGQEPRDASEHGNSSPRSRGHTVLNRVAQDYASTHSLSWEETSFQPSGAHFSPQCPSPLRIRERPLPTLPSQEHTSSPPSLALGQNPFTAERPQPSCPSQGSLSFPSRSDNSYGAPLFRASRADMSQPEAASQGSRLRLELPRPQLQLPTQRKVPDTAQSIQFAVKGNIYGLKHLFDEGLASPRDVSHSRGFSLVRALYGGMCNYKTVQFLLGCGAFVDEESYEHAWDYAYRKKCSSTELAELQCITMDSHGPCKYRDWVDEQQFPLIHKIIFGRDFKPLSKELDDNPDAVRLKDAMGRTALDWATALAQLSDIRLLIDRGSPIDTMDVSGRTTVLRCVSRVQRRRMSGFVSWPCFRCGGPSHL